MEENCIVLKNVNRNLGKKHVLKEAEIDLTESQIRQEKDKLTKYKITALGDGTIISSNFGVGALVSPDSPLKGGENAGLLIGK